MQSKICSICGAHWIDQQHYWSGTQKIGNELDLAGLVCNNLSEPKKTDCINPSLGKEGGDTWASRRGYKNNKLKEFGL